MIEDFDAEESLDEDFLDNEDYESGQRPLIDESFLDEDLLDDSYEDNISDEYDEDYLNEEGFYIEKRDEPEESSIYETDDLFDLKD